MVNDEIIVDSFAGGGGASLGIHWALGKSPDVAINHDEAAIVMHARNHPETRHYTEDVWKVSPRQVTGKNRVGLLWASPDCKHFSRAKGAKPVEKKIRSLAWVIVKWAADVRPRIIMLENVREFQDWGPLTKDAMPDKRRRGLTFKRFVGRLKSLGYSVDWKILNAADYGAPTHRRRLFMIARCDGQEIVWPEPSHEDPLKIENPDLFSGLKAIKPWRTAAECIDWTLPCTSIFERKKPLAEATMNRIALGVKKFVLDAKEPFIVTCNHSGDHFRGQGLTQPFCTIAAARDGHGLVVPLLSKYHGQFKDGKDSRCKSPADPFNVLDTQNRFALVSAFLARTAYKKANGSYVNDPKEPFRTMTAQQDGSCVVSAFLAKHFTGAVGSAMKAPIGTVTTQDHNALIAANLVSLRRGPNPATGCDEPMRTITAGGNHAFLVYSFLTKYFGTGIGQTVKEPLHTVTTKDRFGLVAVTVNGEQYVIVDIGMRMLTPRELARGQGFPDSYILTGSQSSQVAKIGNSVSPVMSEALVKANYTMAEVLNAQN